MDDAISAPRVLAEVLRLQRWAGGESVAADRIFGLLHGFESVLRTESESFGISEEVQEKVEDILQDIENGEQSAAGPSLKDRLWHDKINETHADRVIELCKLQSRFTDAIKMIEEAPGCIFPKIARQRLAEHDWFGALHYMELVDYSAGERAKLHAVFAPTVPRVGEVVRPQKGTLMEVIGVEYVIISQGEGEGVLQNYLVPHVLLQSVDEGDERDD